MRESRRYAFPPLWLVLVLLIGAIGVIVSVSLAWGVLGLVAGLVVIAWLEQKADVYVRSHAHVRGRLTPPHHPSSRSRASPIPKWCPISWITVRRTCSTTSGSLSQTAQMACR